MARRRLKDASGDGTAREWVPGAMGGLPRGDCWVPESALDPEWVAAELEAAAAERAAASEGGAEGAHAAGSGEKQRHQAQQQQEEQAPALEPEA